MKIVDGFVRMPKIGRCDTFDDVCNAWNSVWAERDPQEMFTPEDFSDMPSHEASSACALIMNRVPGLMQEIYTLRNMVWMEREMRMRK